MSKCEYVYEERKTHGIKITGDTYSYENGGKTIRKSRAVGMSEMPLGYLPAEGAYYPIPKAPELPTFRSWGSIKPIIEPEMRMQLVTDNLLKRLDEQVHSRTDELMKRLEDELYNAYKIPAAQFDGVRMVGDKLITVNIQSPLDTILVAVELKL